MQHARAEICSKLTKECVEVLLRRGTHEIVPCAAVCLNVDEKTVLLGTRRDSEFHGAAALGRVRWAENPFRVAAVDYMVRLWGRRIMCWRSTRARLRRVRFCSIPRLAPSPWYSVKLSSIIRHQGMSSTSPSRSGKILLR